VPRKPGPESSEHTPTPASPRTPSGSLLRLIVTQDGIIKRILVKDADTGDYADIVFFDDLDAINRVSRPSRPARYAPPPSRSWTATTSTASTKS
jgi:hypothetical protein